MSYSYWPPYVPVAKRRAKATKAMAKLKKKGEKIEPVEITGRKIAKTFWGAAWCENLETFSDYDNRLPRGRTYVRNGSVCHLGISAGLIDAYVSGSDIYRIRIAIKSLSKNKWCEVKKACSGQIGSMLELLQGRFSRHIMTIITDIKTGLFPKPSEITLDCDCPDGAHLCKHLAAVLYAVGARLDNQPELLFKLRGVDHQELVDTELDIATGKASSGRRLAGQDLGALFDIEVDTEAPIQVQRSKKTTKKRIAKEKPFSATAASVKRLRKSLAMTQSDFARLLGVSQVSVVNWESQRGKLTLQQRSRDKLEKVVGLTPTQANRRLNLNS